MNVKKVIPRGALKRREHGKVGNVFRLVEGPVVGSEGAGERHLTQRHDEVGDPEEHEELEGLQVRHESEAEEWEELLSNVATSRDSDMIMSWQWLHTLSGYTATQHHTYARLHLQNSYARHKIVSILFGKTKPL